MPVVHSLMQVREELDAVPPLSLEQLYAAPGGAGSIGFHLRHLTGSLDRLLTYASGSQLNDEQTRDLASEQAATDEPAAALIARARQRIDAAILQVSGTAIASLDDAREVGRARLPSTVLGLLFHAAEHTQRHAGQIATLVRVVTSDRSRAAAGATA
jgi:uncharacterized damage-inducible protein DinB